MAQEASQGYLEQIPVATFIEDIDKFMVSLLRPPLSPQLWLVICMGVRGETCGKRRSVSLPGFETRSPMHICSACHIWHSFRTPCLARDTRRPKRVRQRRPSRSFRHSILRARPSNSDCHSASPGSRRKSQTSSPRTTPYSRCSSRSARFDPLSVSPIGLSFASRLHYRTVELAWPRSWVRRRSWGSR